VALLDARRDRAGWRAARVAGAEDEEPGGEEPAEEEVACRDAGHPTTIEHGSGWDLEIP
jgi:hypothetical protein